jgi:16S rRNA (guanine966-N2)-methyltransferase
MSDRVRGGLFNTLGDIEGLAILDAFAGTGALSFEALSRGAERVLAIDIDKNAQNTSDRSIKQLNLEKQMKLVRANASGWSDNNPDSQFDIVIAAPPYDDLQLNLVKKLTRHTKSEGLYVLDWPGREPIPQLDGHELLTVKDYGDAQIAFYRKQ